MKPAAGLALVITILIVASPAFGTSLRLDKVMDGRVPQVGAEVRGAGGYYGDCIRVDIINDSGQPVTVDVPLGLLLVPDRQSVQTMVCSGGERLDAGPGRTTHRIKAFCGEEHDSAPGTGTSFTNGGRASGELLKRLREILRDGRFDSSTQRLVWNVSQSLDLSKGAGPSPAEKKATGAAALTTLILLIWQIANGLVKVPGGGLPAPQVPAPADEEPAEPAGDRPSWSLMNRKENDVYDAANERWVDRDSERARQMFMDKRREMSRKGYDYDDERDAFVKRGLEYDEEGDAYRESLPERRPAELDAEKGDAARIKLGPGFFVPGDQWLFSRGPQTKDQYREVYKPLEDRLKYLDEREEDIKNEHEAALRQEKKAREVNDEWLAEQWRKRAEETKDDVRRVQEQKLDLTKRVDQHNRDAETWAERQKKSWTVGKVVKEVGSTLVPNPEDLRPLFEQTIKLRNRLQKAINDDPKLLVLPKDPSKIDPALERIRGQARIFKDVDETMERIKSTAAALKEAQDIGDGKASKALSRELEAARGKLKDLNAEMQNIHKLSAQWQAGSHALTGTSALTTMQYYGQTKMAVDVGKAGAQYFKPTTGSRAPRMLDEDGNIIGKPPKPKPGPQVADGSAASPEDMSRRQNYEFFAVKKDGSVRPVGQTGNVDAAAEKGELIVIRDKATGGISKHKFYGEGAGEKPMHPGQKNLLWKKAQEALGGGEAKAEAAGTGGPAGGGGGESGGGAGGTSGGGTGEGSGSSGGGTEGGSGSGSGGGGTEPPQGPPPKPVKLPRDLRELKDMVDQERAAGMAKKSGDAQQEAARFEDIARQMKDGQKPVFKDHDVPGYSRTEWLERDRALGIKPDTETDPLKVACVKPDARAEDLAARNPRFAEIDKAVRKAWQKCGRFSGNTEQTNLQDEKFFEILQEEHVSKADLDNWQRALENDEWKPVYQEKPGTFNPDGSRPVKPGVNTVDVPPPAPQAMMAEPPPQVVDIGVEPARAPVTVPTGQAPAPSAAQSAPVGPAPIKPESPAMGAAMPSRPAAPAAASPPAPQPAPAAPASPMAQAPTAQVDPAQAAQPATPIRSVGTPDVPSAGPALEGAGELGGLSMKEAGGLEGFDLESHGLESAGRESVGLKGAAGLEDASTLGQAAGGLEQGSTIQRNSSSFARMLESVFGKKE